MPIAIPELCSVGRERPRLVPGNRLPPGACGAVPGYAVQSLRSGTSGEVVLFEHDADMKFSSPRNPARQAQFVIRDD